MQASHPLFAGTNVSNGSLIGTDGLNAIYGIGGAASGWEMDTSIAGTAPAGTIVGATSISDDISSPRPTWSYLPAVRTRATART